MGARKKEANRRERQGTAHDGMANVKVKGENFYRYVEDDDCLVVLY
jgi:nuclear GTP-binding protein